MPAAHSSPAGRSRCTLRVLVVGWFSFEGMGATAGDLMASDVVKRWLTDAKVAFDVAVVPPFVGGIDLADAKPSQYSHLVFVCGPFGNGPPITNLLERFEGTPLIGIDLSLLESLTAWNPFQRVFPRDVDRQGFPDLSLAAVSGRVPVVGLILADPQNEYGNRGKHALINGLIDSFIETQDAAVVPIDTRLDVNRTGLRTADEITSVIAKMDIVITTRLHGMVLALKEGVPALAIDAIEGGAKVTLQADALDWPYCLSSSQCTVDSLTEAYGQCLSLAARERAAICRDRSTYRVNQLEREFLAELGIEG